MKDNDKLRELLVEFFQLPPDTPENALNQTSIGKWDSLATVQLITEIQSTFSIEFDLDEIEQLTSYQEIRAALSRRGL